MPGLVPGIHALPVSPRSKTWMAGTSPAMTVGARRFGSIHTHRIVLAAGVPARVIESRSLSPGILRSSIEERRAVRRKTKTALRRVRAGVSSPLASRRTTAATYSPNEEYPGPGAGRVETERRRVAPSDADSTDAGSPLPQHQSALPSGSRLRTIALLVVGAGGFPGRPGSRVTSPARRRRIPDSANQYVSGRHPLESGWCKDNPSARNVKINYFTQKQYFA